MWLIAKAIIRLKFKTEWTHIGGGNDFEELKKQTANLPKNIKINLTGQVSANDVPNYYANKQVDLFINASTTEGLPVSVMEAFAAGIPALATDVGGTSELVNSSTGKLLPADLTPSILAKEITRFKNKNSEHTQLLRKNAFAKFENIVDFEKNTNMLVEYLKKLR